MKSLYLSIILTCGIITQVFPKRMQDSDVAYMQKYGYMELTVEGGKYTDEEMKEGLMRFQRFNNMNVTGEMSDSMHNMMGKPRCGMKDMHIDMPSTHNRARRYVLVGARWPSTKLTYRYVNFSPDLGEGRTRDAIQRALKVWSDVSPLEFTEDPRNSNADILILFQGGEHGDGVEAAFDGPFGVLAHAYFPSPGIGGDAHFDEDEQFSDNGQRNTIDLFQVAAHEFGHALGLAHSEVEGALMAPYYAGYIQNFKLPQDDIAGIQALYGPKRNTPTVGPRVPDAAVPTSAVSTLAPTSPPVVPDMCKYDMNAVLYDQTGVFIFQGKEVTRLEMRGTQIQGYPKRISKVFKGLQNNIDAAYYRFTDRTHLFFKKDLYWEFDRQRVMKAGFPKPITEFSSMLSKNIDAAVTWGSYYTYFFKGSRYWRYNERAGIVDPGYPKSIEIWKGLPTTGLDAGFRWLDGELYFVKDGQYYFYDARMGGVNPSVYPRSFGEDWLSCRPNSYEYNPYSSGHMHVYSLSALLVTLSWVFYL